MSPEMIYPQLAEALQQAQQRAQSLLDEHMHQLNTESFQGTDEAKTVSVTLDARQRLTRLYIEYGLLRLGTETVAQRINEAIQNAHAAVTAANEAEQQLLESVPDIPDSFKEMLGLIETKPV